MEKSFLLLFLLLLLPCSLTQASEPASEYRQANKLFASARFDEALSLYRKLLADPPKNIPLSDIHTRIGDSWFRLGSYERSLAAYRHALKGQKESRRSENQYWIGFCCFLLGRNDEAVEEFLKIPALYPRSGMWVGTAYYWAGRSLERMGKAAEASVYYRKAGGNGRSTQGRFALKKAETVKNAD